MSKKSKGILKFIIACGVVISAVCAVFAVLYRMHSKLKAVDEGEQEDDGACDGECEGCTLCGDDVEQTDEDSETEADADVENADIKE
ncbi:MAG: hypothetical protein IKB51_00110 [Clostridia bacterium]|nr:hypothetical protein [Clostridia bacterium]